MRLIVLIPHRDSLIEYKKYCRALFSAGVYSALSFPVVIPIAIVSRPHTAQELKNAAAQFRIAHNAKWTTGALTEIAIPQGLFFTGAVLNSINNIYNVNNETKNTDVIFAFKRLLLCAACRRESLSTFHSTLADPPLVAFRAAAVANMVVSQIDKIDASCKTDGSFEWKIGRLFWLPK